MDLMPTISKCQVAVAISAAWLWKDGMVNSRRSGMGRPHSWKRLGFGTISVDCIAVFARKWWIRTGMALFAMSERAHLPVAIIGWLHVRCLVDTEHCRSQPPACQLSTAIVLAGAANSITTSIAAPTNQIFHTHNYSAKCTARMTAVSPSH